MADLKISALTGATTPLAGTEVLPIVQSSSTVKVSVANLTAGRAVSMASATISGDLTVDTNTLLVDSTNNYVGIGGTPSVPLEVYASNSGIVINNTATSNKKWRLGGGSASQFSITEAGVADRLKIDTAGDITAVGGNFVIGTSGKGIDFSATSGTGTSELLADYEEGTWTPVIGGSTATSGQTYDLQAGYYTKVGRLVTVNFRVALTAKGTITGDAQIQGLPYTIKNANGGQSSAAIGTFVLATNVVFVSGTGVLNGTAINLTKLAILGSASTNMVVADIDPTSAFMGCFSYVV